MKWKKILSLLMVAVIVSSLFAVLGSAPASADEYVDHIRLEVRMDQSVGVGDTAAGVLDAFIQAVEGPIYDGVDDAWKANLNVLESYGSYNEIMFNTATTHGYAEVDSNNDGTPDMFNPFAIREVRYATNWLISRQTVVEDIYDGFGIAQYSAIGQRNPAWAERLQPIIDEHGITYAGDFDIAYNMIQDAMTAAMDHDDLMGEIRAPEGGRNFWQYQAPGGDWIDIETVGHIRIEDRRHEIGYMFSDLLEDCGIKVDRFDMDRTVMTWLFGEAADMEWGFYTGGWLASSAVLYQHAGLAQMYTHHYPFMPGDAYLMYFDPGARYAYSRDDPAAEELYELAAPLMAGEIPNMDVYWEYFEALMDRGVHESVRVFVQTSIDYIPLNRDRITEIATDVVIGWSQFFSPRTIKTQDGNFRAAQFSAGQLYRDNWNNIGGFADTYSVTQARMTRDFATIIHPARGTSIPMRAEWTEIITDYDYDDDGVLEKNIPIPDDVVNYCVFDEEWTEGYGWNYDAEGNIVEHDYAASAVTYKWHFGTWHSGHDFDMQDLVAYFAFSKQLCWQTDAGGHYYVGAWAASQPYYNNILGIVFDEAEDTVTIYGDYTFPAEDQIAGYYMWMPEVPWQLYEAATQLIGMTDLAPATTLNDQPYSWSSAPGRNYVHWLSTTQGNDFDATLANIASEEWVPPYLRADRNSPIPLAPGDVGSDIGDIRAFFAEYEHHWITHGPFKLTVHDPANLIIEMERWTQADGYPWPEDYWRDRLAVARLRLGTLTAPRRVNVGDDIDLRVRARIAEEYPERGVRDLTADHGFEVSASLWQEGVVVWEADPEDISLVASHFEVTIPGDEIADLGPGIYEARISAVLEGQIAIAEATAGVRIAEEVEPIPEGLEDFELTVTPKSGRAPLEVTISVSAKNVGETDESVSVFIDGRSVYTLDVDAGETESGVYTHTFSDAGDYLISFGDQSDVVEVQPEEVIETPGFAFALMAVSLILAVVVYHKKKEL